MASPYRGQLARCVRPLLREMGEGEVNLHDPPSRRPCASQACVVAKFDIDGGPRRKWLIIRLFTPQIVTNGQLKHTSDFFSGARHDASALAAKTRRTERS